MFQHFGERNHIRSDYDFGFDISAGCKLFCHIIDEISEMRFDFLLMDTRYQAQSDRFELAARCRLTDCFLAKGQAYIVATIAQTKVNFQ